MNLSAFGLSFAAAWLLVGSTQAQSFNLDDGDQGAPFGLATPTYGAAAGQTGTWVALGTIVGVSAPLSDISGAATPVTLTRSSGYPSSANLFNLAGDDAAMMCDIFDPTASSTYTFDHLQPGDYAVYSYAWAPDDNTARTIVTPGAGAVEAAQTVGGTWSGGAHVLGVTYALHHFVNVAPGGSIALTFSVGMTFGSINGFQIVRTPGASTFTPYCFGDGSGTACPCGNAGAAGNGCASSINAAGANLAAAGTPSIANDTLALIGSGMPNSSALFFQGTTQIANLFGDGIRCAGGSVIRLGTKINTGGSSTYPNGSTPISIKGNDAAGNTRTYQVWYRNPASFCTPSTFNLTNGVSTTWAP